MRNGSGTLSSWGTATDVRVGLDVGDTRSRWAAVDVGTGELREGFLATTPGGVQELFAGAPQCVVVLEAGTHSPWLARLLDELGQRAVVVDARALEQGQGRRRRRKNDRKDALGLMDLARDVGRPRVKELWQRPREYQEDLALMRMRDAMVRSRALLVNATRGMVKQFGERVKDHSVESVPRFAREELSERVRELAEPALEQVERATTAVERYDGEVAKYLARRSESVRLLQVHGVGPVTVGVYMAVVGDPRRFRRSRDVPAYLGLVPGEDQSGEVSQQLRIIKSGDELARRVLVQCAHFMMSSRGEDSALRRWALAMAGDGTNKVRKKKAAIALARKLATLLHRLWVSGETYEPLRGIAPESAEEVLAA